jgi:PAS domain S-box-containing protein
MERLTRQAIRRRLSRDRTEASVEDLDEIHNPVLTGSWIYTIGADKDRIWVSEGIGRIFGITVPGDGYVPIETIGRCIPDREKVRLSLRQLVKDGGEHDMEFEVVPADGGPRRIVLSVAEMMEETVGTGVRMSGAIWDITDILLLDSRMRRLNRELTAIKECARAVIKARSEQELWDSICRIVCEIAEYRLTWVGLAEHNDSKDIRPVAWSGYNEEYVLSVRATWGDGERGTGPAGVSIKTGRTTFIQDVMNDDRYDLWRENALKNGYRSLIAIPLMDSGEAFGALMIYSDRADGFTAEEVELLEEMAGDLALGIITLRMRREREKAMDALKRVEARNRTLYDLSQMTGATSKDLTERAMNSCISLSDSKFGFVAFVNEDETALTMQNWSKQVMEECMVVNRPYTYNVVETGSWTESLRLRRPVIVNRYSEPHANKRGLPAGHVRIERFMTVPVFDRGQIVAVLGVANKESDYTEEDATDLSLLMDGMWRIVRKLKAEEELKEHHNLLNSFAENIPDAIYMKDLDGRYIMMNPGGAALLGMDSKDVLGKDDKTLFGTEVAAQLRCEDQEVIEGRQARFYEATNVIRGRRTTYSTWKAPYVNSDGEIIGVMGYSRDITEKKAAEEALQRSEQMLKIVIDNFPGVVFWKDRNLVYLGANKESATNVGFDDPSECVGRTDYDLPWAETEADAYRADDLQVMESGVPKLHIIERQQRLNGKFGWLDTCKVPLRDKDGKVVGILGTATDITEKKSAEDALRQANLIVENSPVMLFRWRAEEGWPVELVSKNIVRFGYEPEMFLDGSLLFSDIVHPDDLDGIKAALGEKIRQGEDSYEGVYRIRNRDGEYHWVDQRTFLGRDSEGTVTKFQGILIDITERVEAEKRLQAINEALKEGEEKYQELFELGSEALFLIEDETGKVLECNTAASEMYGYSHKELLESFTPDLLAKRGEPESKMIENRNGSVIIPLEYHRRKDGRMFPVEINCRSFTWKGLQVHVAAVRDITERIRTSEALRQVNKKLNLLNNITRHDLKNQMTALTGNMALAKMKRADPSFDVYMEKALASADSMAAIIKFAEAYEEIGVREAIWHDLKTLVIDSVGDVPPSRLRIINDIPAGIEVFADPLIKKVFYNLVDNAIRHGGKATTIRFSVERVGGSHAIVCEDDGLGISADIRSKLFNRGFGKNHGLGLFLSREILAITGITMTEEGEPGKGARFVMSVPREGLRGVYQ